MDILFNQLEEDLQKSANPEKAVTWKRFFKTGPGQYSEQEIFLGIMVPQLRKLAKTYHNLAFEHIKQLLYSPIHEERLLSLLILVQNFQKNKENGKISKKIYSFLVKNIKQVNNWALVDFIVWNIVGPYLQDKPKDILYKWAKSANLWIRRSAIISTNHYIKQNLFSETLKIADMLLNDQEDLIHKAVGWMLREIGKRDQAVEEKFLKSRYKKMPRTMLRYAIERFEESKRQAYLKNQI